MTQLRRWFWEADTARSGRAGVIAEIGVNHDGRPQVARELIRAAAEAGADAVKFQLFDPDRLLSGGAKLAGYQRGQADDAKSLLRGLALDVDTLAELGEVAHGLGLRFIVTPFSIEDAHALSRIPIDAVKIASPDAVNTPLLEAAAALGKPMYVSTGTCELRELECVASLLKEHEPGGVLLQCVSSYPTPAADASLNGMRAMRQCFGLPVGYSDHTQDVLTGALAVAAGALLVEKHVTYDRHASGPDHSASAGPEQFADYVRLIRQAELMLGPVEKRVQAVERDVRVVSRQSVCAACDLRAGQPLCASDLTVKRPGTGIPAGELKSLIGQTLVRDVPADQPLVAADLAQVVSISAA